MLFSVYEQGEVVQYVTYLVCFMLPPALIRCVRFYYKDQQMRLVL